MSEDICCKGGPYGGCFIVYGNTLKVDPIYFENEKRVCGITITLPHSSRRIIFNVYMPCDDYSTESFDMYSTAQRHCPLTRRPEPARSLIVNI